MSEKKYIQSIQRSGMILDYLATKGKAKLNEISEATGIKTSTAFGIIQTLEEIGQISRINNGLEYTFGINSLRYGLSYLTESGVNKNIHEILLKLVEVSNETAYFAINVGERYYFMDSVYSSHPLRVVPGEDGFVDLPIYSALGKIFFGNNNNIDYALDLEEVYEGMNCLGIPYRKNGKIIGVVALSGPSHRFSTKEMLKARDSYIDLMKNLNLEEYL